MVKIIFIIIKVIIIIILVRVKMIVTATLVYLVVTTDSNAFLDRRNKQTNYNAKEKKCKTFPKIAYCAVIFSIAGEKPLTSVQFFTGDRKGRDRSQRVVRKLACACHEECEQP